MPYKIKIAFIVLFLIIYCFAFQGKRGLFDPDEGRYSAVALQMLKTNDWLHPRTHPNHEHWTKPPLTYWAIAASILTFGMSEFAVRFPNVMSFFLTIIISFFLGKVFVPKRPWIVSLVFATFLFPATVCNGATTDYPVTMWETLAVCFFASAFWRNNDRIQIILILLSWVAFGLAFLTKGPPGILPLLAIIIFLQFNSVKEKKFNMHWFAGILIFLAVGGSWYFMVIYEKFELLQYFVWDEIVLRLFSGHHERHSSWYAFLYIYFPVIIFGSLPWIYYAAKGMIESFRVAKISFNSANVSDERLKSLFLIIWFLFPLSIFIISKSNLPLYVLPLFVPLAIITARKIDASGISLDKIRNWIVAWCVLLVFVRIVMGTIPFKRDASKFASAIEGMHPHYVEEILFVNTREALGLQFYTGSDIGRVSMEVTDIQIKIEEEKSKLWVVLEDEVEYFIGNVNALNKSFKKLGRYAGWKNYVVFMESDANIN